MPIQFGLYAGSACGDDASGIVSGPPDDAAAIHRALEILEDGTLARLRLRSYVQFDDARGAQTTDIATPLDAQQYAVDGRQLDLVALYQSRAADVEGYASFVRRLVRRFGPITATLQITEEPNVRGNAVLDGDYPDVTRAIVLGVAAANDEARRCGFDHLRVGLNTTPLFGPSAHFYTDLVAVGGRALIDGLAYIGLDMFPDVFRPVADGDIRKATRGLLTYHRRDILKPVGLGHLPIHITEHGWPTTPERTPQRQAEVIRDVIDAVAEVHEELNVAAYELFALRDANSLGRDLYHGFGIMTDDYVPKQAFGVFKNAIARYG